MAAEWWHFQYVTGLVQGKTTFGQELLRIYPQADLNGKPPWKYRDYIYGINWF